MFNEQICTADGCENPCADGQTLCCRHLPQPTVEQITVDLLVVTGGSSVTFIKCTHE